MFAEVAPGVYSVEHRVAEGKNALICGRRGALAIDGGTYTEEGQAMADYLRKRGYVADRLALTHGHGDHVLGAKPLADGEVYAHARTPGVIRRHAVDWARRQQRSLDRLIAELPMPTVTYTDELCIDLGDVSARFFPTPGHSEDGVSAYVEERRLLVGGDAVVTGIVPAIGDGDSRVLEASLRRLLDMDIDILLPGHGPVVCGAADVRGWIAWEAAYLSGVRDRVAELLSAGWDGDALVEQVDFAQHSAGRLSAEKHGMLKRHQATVAVVVGELKRAGEGA